MLPFLRSSKDEEKDSNPLPPGFSVWISAWSEIEQSSGGTTDGRIN